MTWALFELLIEVAIDSQVQSDVTNLKYVVTHQSKVKSSNIFLADSKVTTL